MHVTDKEITWQAPEFRYQTKDVSWYWTTIGIAGILFLIALWQGNLLFGIFIILAEIMLVVWAKEFPKSLQFEIDAHGVHLDRIASYSYDDLEGFHIHEGEDGVGELILKTKKRMHPYITILLLNDDTQPVREFLKNHLGEIDYEESLSENLSRLIGF